MKKNKALQKIVFIFLILCMCLLCFLVFFLLKIEKTNNQNLDLSIITGAEDIPKTIEEVINKYESKYMKEEDNTIYVIFSKDLYDENGNSNEKFFSNLCKDLEYFFEEKDFYLEDKRKDINIYVKYDLEEKEHIIYYNNMKDFFEKTNGKDYIDVENVNFAKESKNIYSINPILKSLKLGGMKLRNIEESIGEGEQLENGYISYLDGKIKLRKVAKNIVRNIIFSKDYEEQIFKDVTNNNSLEDILEIYPDNCFGGLDKDYLGYRSNELYYFIYKDEISVYGYSYSENKSFEELLSNYLKDKDLDVFIKGLSNKMPTYDFFEYNPETQEAHIMYSSYGIEINIIDNNPKGVILYNNYYFTYETKQFVKNGLITFKNNKNSIEKIEAERRNNN